MWANRTAEGRVRPRVVLPDRLLDEWPAPAQHLAADLLRAYGKPHAVSDSLLVWYFNSPWKRTALHREGVVHNFPRPHLDFLEQTITLRVPAEAYSRLAEFNGSLIVHRTRGELTAYCRDEELNFLLLNLAYDVVTGKRTVDEARRKCAAVVRLLGLRWPEPYASGLHFTTNTAVLEEPAAADPDQPARSVLG